MSQINMVGNIKDLFPNYVVLVRIGTFYDAYFYDAKILAYIFKYKIKSVSGVDVVGFPTSSVKRVLYILEQKSINYILVDKKHNYEEEEKQDFKKKNKYEELKKEAIFYLDNQNRIDKISTFLKENVDKISIVEELLYERKL